ncbi:MAG: ATP-dependent helicase [Candidatus Latescibacterota bacterium]|nr:MAG: ATP-dependent helicase [Candidatus Latescibacterota bacterium]
MEFSSDAVFENVLGHPLTHFRVLGPPGSGKTRLLVERYHALKSRRDNEEEDVFVITYSNESHRRLTAAIVAKSTARLGAVPILKHSRLAEEILLSSGKKPPVIIRDLEEHLLLDEVIGDCQRRLESDLRSICRSERFRRDLLDVCHVLLQNDIGGEALSKLTSSPKTTTELNDIFTLYRAYREELEKRGLATYYNISWIALGCLENHRPKHPAAAAAVLLIEDFQDIDPGQFELLRALAPPNGKIALNVFGDPMGPVFGHRGTQHRYLMEEFPRLYGPKTFHLPAGCPHTDVVGKTIETLIHETLKDDAENYLPPSPLRWSDTEPDYGDDRTHQMNRADADSFRIETARNELDEAYVVAARIRQLLHSGFCQPNEIAVITNKKDRYMPSLKLAMRQRGIPIDSGRRCSDVFDGLVFSLLTLFDSRDDVIAARSILTSPLYDHLRKGVWHDDAEPVNPGRDDIEKVLSFVDEMAKNLRTQDKSKWMDIFVLKCLHPMATSYYEQSGDDSVLRDTCRLLESWRAYVAALEKVGGKASIRTFMRVSGFFSRPSATPQPAPHAVGFYSCREAKGLSFPVVFVVGCSELLFPSAGRRHSVVPVAELQSVFEEALPDRPTRMHAAHSPADQLQEEYHLLYLSLTRARRLLYLTAPEIFGGQDHPAPCSVLQKTIPSESYVSTPNDEKLPPQIRFAREWTAGASDPGIESRLLELSPVGARWHEARPRAKPVKIDRFPLSKSSIETYLECQRRFFYRKILRIPEEETAPARVGSLLHGVMAILGSRFRTKKELHRGATTDVVHAVIDDVIGDDEKSRSDSFFDRSLRYHLQRMVEKILELDDADAADYTIRGVEENIPFNYRGWDFAGRIDRVDEVSPGGQVIVDYKTGKLDKTGKTIRKKTLFALDAPEKAMWQVPLYVWGFKSREKRLPLAFKHVVTSTDDDPFAVTLFVCPRESEIPPEAKSNKRCSYLLDTELEEILNEAATIAETIFEPRPRFEKSTDESPCRNCEFKRLCEREGE